MLRSLAFSVASPLLRCARAAAAVPPMIRGPTALAPQQQRDFRPYRRMGRGLQHRMDMLSNMVTSLIEHERIKTTKTKAKELRRLSDKLVTYAKRGSVIGRRRASQWVRRSDMLVKLFTILVDRYKERNGGYTRVLLTYPRIGDAAPMAYVELVDRPMKRMPSPLPEQHGSVYPGRGGRMYRAGRRNLRNEIK